MYFERHGRATGDAPPLLLLHGGFRSIATNFGQMLPTLTKDRRIIAVEQQGHGPTADIDRPLTCAQEVDDPAAALDQLGSARVDVFGSSAGGNVALGLAIRHPALVRKVTIAGTNITNDDLVPGLSDFMTGMTPDRTHLVRAPSPAPGDFRQRHTGGDETRMCRNIRPLFNFEPAATEEEIRAASLQFVRKISGFTKPSRANEAAFNAAVEDIAAIASRLLSSLESPAPPKNRDEEAAKAKARSALRFGT